MTVLRTGHDLTVVTYGATVDAALEAAECLEADGLSVEVIKLNDLTPTNWTNICEHIKTTGRLVVVEECVAAGSVGQRLTSQLTLQRIALKGIELLNVGDRFITQGSVQELRKLCGLDTGHIVETARKVVKANG